MLRDARELTPGATINCDLCVLGAGAAGITLARDLRRSGIDVCVLESGGLEPEAEVQDLYRGRSTGLPYEGLSVCRQRFFGGTTNHWTGFCRPLETEDMEPRPWLPGSTWPIPRRALEPYYVRAHETCEIGAVEYHPEVIAKSVGRSPLSLDPARARSVVYRISPPTRFGERYRHLLEASTDVEVYMHANATSLRLADSDRVDSVRVSTLGGKRFTVRAGRYVLAMGGVENARMLLASREQRSEGVANSSGTVGAFFAEHPHLYDAGYLLADGSVDLSFYAEDVTLPGTDGAGGVSVVSALGLSTALARLEQLPAFSCRLWRVPLERIETEGRTGPVPPSRIAPLVAAAGETISTYRMVVMSEQRPTRASRVGLVGERDALGMPRVELSWRIADEDIQAVGRGMQLLGAELARVGVGRVWIPLDPRGRYDPPQVIGGCHHMGTTRMSDDPRKGVVDRDGRTHDCPNLYVAGSSVFPSSGLANPTLTLVALAHRLADHLRESP